LSANLAYTVHVGFGFGRAPFVGRDTIIVGIVHEGDEALAEFYGGHITPAENAGRTRTLGVHGLLGRR
jgi:hypothetical protein